MKRAPLVLIIAGVLTGCVGEQTTKTERAPAEVGGRFNIAGITFGGDKDNPYGYRGDASQTEAQLREQSRKFDKTVWQGVLIGAVAGGVIGVVAGGDGESAAGGAIAGAAVGALAGMYIANKQKQYSSTEDQLASMIADVQRTNTELAALVADAEAVLREDQRRLEALQARLRKGQASEQDLQQERARAWGNRQVAERAAVGARDQYRVFKSAEGGFAKANPGTSTQGFTREIEGYRASIDRLDGIVKTMGQA